MNTNRKFLTSAVLQFSLMFAIHARCMSGVEEAYPIVSGGFCTSGKGNITVCRDHGN